MPQDDEVPARLRWARRRFSIIGPLLAAPPGDGELHARIEQLASQAWQHPTTGELVKFSFKTIERWYYAARSAADPVTALARQVPSHAGTHPSIAPALADAIVAQHRDHPRWSYQLHHANLCALARQEPQLGAVPGYATIVRFMKSRGLARGKLRATAHRDRTKRRIAITRFAASRSHKTPHRDHPLGSRSPERVTRSWGLRPGPPTRRHGDRETPHGPTSRDPETEAGAEAQQPTGGSSAACQPEHGL